MSKQQKQAGFTLVELAIVMIIIGLLIAGVLKGQQLIGNARVTSQVAQIKGIDGAVSTFRDMYASLPGDIATPGARLPNCTATGGCSTGGDGNGRLGNILTASPVAASEGYKFFTHLNAADLLTGINPGAATPISWGGIFPEAKISGAGLYAGNNTGLNADFTNAIGANAPATGTYLALTQTANAAPAVALTPNQAARLDNKIDDSIPDTGSVRAFGLATCASNGAGAAYIESSPGQLCGIYIRIQG